MAANSEVGPEGLLRGAGLLSRPAEEFENDPSVELMWAKKAYEHAEIYFNILCSVDPTLLKLTGNDSEIYETFRKDFPGFNIEVVNEDEMKSSSGKERWREYCEKFKNKVEDYSFGTLLRKDCTGEYTEDNSMLVTRIQFLAIELARNKEGCNNCIRRTWLLLNYSFCFHPMLTQQCLISRNNPKSTSFDLLGQLDKCLALHPFLALHFPVPTRQHDHTSASPRAEQATAALKVFPAEQELTQQKELLKDDKKQIKETRHVTRQK